MLKISQRARFKLDAHKRLDEFQSKLEKIDNAVDAIELIEFKKTGGKSEDAIVLEKEKQQLKAEIAKANSSLEN